jgi:hypothetical protein
MKILINNSVIEIYDNHLYDYYLFDSSNPIIISDLIKKNKYYTYLIINTNTDSINEPFENIYIHLLIINNNNIIFNYEKPKPSKYTGIHIYSILIYEQFNIIYLKINERININLDNFVKKNNLLLIDKFIFQVIHK